MTERVLEPLGLITGPAASASLRAGLALPFQGGPIAFTLARLIEAGADRGVVAAAAIPPAWQALLPPITTAPQAFAGILPHLKGGPLVMGILNVTPDSFSGDGVDAPA